jgi:hypothetical protein
MIELMRRIKPLRVITTNIDMCLESNVPEVSSFSRTNIEFAKKALPVGEGFILKLHGSASQMESTVWTEEDYAEVAQDHQFLTNLSQLLSQASIVFIGYSLRDKYIIDLLEKNQACAALLGDGPHFVITSETDPCQGPSNVRIIKYLTSNFADHRTALAVLDLLRFSTPPPQAPVPPVDAGRLSAIYLPDYLTFGTWTTSQIIEFSDLSDNPAGRAIIGSGFVQEEMPRSLNSGLHDLIVGLMCFDRIYFPLIGVGKLYEDISKNYFLELINSDVFRFVWKASELVVIFDGEKNFTGGALSQISLSSGSDREAPAKLGEVLDRVMPGAWANEAIKDKISTAIERATIKFDESILGGYPKLAEGALLAPRLRKNLGLSDSFLSSNIPEWLVFPVLRVAMVVQDAEISRHLGASAAKIPFGSDALANATYGVSVNKHSASDYAAYAVSGRFKADLGKLAVRNPELLGKILEFRYSAIGESFRHEVRDLLDANEGSEFVSAINGRLRETISFEILDQVRDYFVDVSCATDRPSILSASSQGDDPFAPWRRRSGKMLEERCRSLGISQYSICPCGSGDKLKFCCGLLL